MDRKDAVAWVLSVCDGLIRKSQANTLSILVASALSALRLSLAGIGRELAASEGKAAKHAIKRVWRFVRNDRVEPSELMTAVMDRLWKRTLRWHAKRPDRRPLRVSLDWTKVRRFHTLMAAVVIEGRALPLCWASYRGKVEGKSQNAKEYAMLALIRSIVGPKVRLVILADRGFGRAGLIEQCQKLGLDYLVRIVPDVIVESRIYKGNLKAYPLARGECRLWKAVSYRSDGLVTTNLLLRWKKGLVGDKDQPWYLATSLQGSDRRAAMQISDLYALRFDIEELFRDAKNEHLGWSLARTRVTRPDRLDRLILIAALAYLLLIGLGLWCRAHRPARLWASNNRRNELSAFAIGRIMLARVDLAVRTILRVLLDCLFPLDAKRKWG
jgi:hypothetical protein